jgi:putative SOS response-associated peptidase YedK
LIERCFSNLWQTRAILWGMCGRYTNTAGPEELDDRFRVPIPAGEGVRRYNIAPTESVLAIVAPKGKPEARLLRWGLLPPWSKDLQGAFKMINARLETVASKPAYRKLIPTASRRALQIADGYYEWLKPERRGEPRQPFHFQVDGGVPFAFAALWNPAKIEGEWVESCTLLTCDSASNPVARAIHERMPVMLADPELQRAWLDQSLDAEEALALCGPLPASRLSARPANPAVNRVDREAEGPELLQAPATSPDPVSMEISF